jgi:tight adherence protein B
VIFLSLALLGTGLAYGIRQARRQSFRRAQARSLRIALQQMTHALRVGVGFQQALVRAVSEGDPLLASEWERVLHGLQIGKPLRKALEELPKRVPVPEMRWFVTAVIVTHQSGGSLAGVLEVLGQTLQERETLQDKIAALTAQGKASGMLLCALPFLLMGALQLMAPEMIRPLFVTTLGGGLFFLICSLIAAGALLIQKIVTLSETA